jgi:hypothetical protein
MGDPTMLIAMTVMKVGGAIMEGRQQKKMAQMQAQSYERQAVRSEIEAAHAASDRLRQLRSAISEQTAGQAAYGRSITAGGTSRALSDYQRGYGMRDVSRIEEAGKFQSEELSRSASNVRVQGRMAMQSSYLKAGGALLGAFDPKLSGAPGVKTTPTPPKTKSKVTSFGGRNPAVWGGQAYP